MNPSSQKTPLGRRSFLHLAAAAASSAAGVSAAGAVGAACRPPLPREAGRTVATLWFSYGGKNREVLLDLVSRFNASQSRVTIRATFQGDYFEALAKLRTALAANVAPTFSHVVGEVIPYLARAQVLEPLDSYERCDEFIPQLGQKGAFRDGHTHPTVAIPFNRSTPIMYANANLLKTLPSTWDELRDTARRLTRPSVGDPRWGFEVPISWWFWVAMLGQAGGTLIDTDGTPSLGADAGERALRFWQTLVHTDRSMRPPAGRDYNAWQVTNQDFLAGRAAVIWTSTAFLRYLEDTASFPVIAAPLPKDLRASVPTGGTFFVILRSAPPEEKEAAWTFLRWMCQPEQTISWATRTGYLPVTQAAVAQLRDSGYYDAHPNDRVAYEQLSAVEPWPWVPNLFRIQRDIVEPRLEDAVHRNLDAHAVMNSARAAARRPV
ncbi:MAG: ABC transporter substrate-binding protein [Myxococcales bacterium]